MRPGAVDAGEVAELVRDAGECVDDERGVRHAYNGAELPRRGGAPKDTSE